MTERGKRGEGKSAQFGTPLYQGNNERRNRSWLKGYILGLRDGLFELKIGIGALLKAFVVVARTVDKGRRATTGMLGAIDNVLSRKRPWSVEYYATYESKDAISTNLHHKHKSYNQGLVSTSQYPDDKHYNRRQSVVRPPPHPIVSPTPSTYCLDVDKAGGSKVTNCLKSKASGEDGSQCVPQVYGSCQLEETRWADENEWRERGVP
ncbi:hypothetical protein K443DRAFT_121885 [Laccaria amethystina LaAM-08-1]|uniref:Uncharacterized protein n=1 Tax=Laccaria amethystina LaAM-08-1 TaxID=1095629 RepID=A0A0C9XY25_9AGAR|nr:hypothetical protein K443DRAFT_121885 [Laccaria amethystina LaAM-08-1]